MSLPYRLPRNGALVVFDTEFTAWEGSVARGWSGPGEHREIIQIGAVRLDCAAGFREIETLSVLVRPRRNPVLSDYIQSLTGIDQARIERDGLDFPTAFAQFAHLLRGAPLLSWGWDNDVILENLSLHDMSAGLWPDNFTNLRRAAIGLHGERFKACSSASLPHLFGLPAAENAHDALEDARAIARSLPSMVEEGLF